MLRLLITRERESNSALNLSSFQLSLRALHFYAMRGTSPQLQSSDLAHKREWVQLCKQNPQVTICHTEVSQKPKYLNTDCHEFASANSRNDGNPYWDKDFTNSRNDKSTHPLLSPSAREGEIIQNNEISTKINQQKYIKLAQVDSIRTDFVQAYLPQEITTSKIDSTQKHLPQATMDSMQVANNTANAQNNAFINNHRDISRYALNMTNDIDSRQATDSAQIDSMQMFFAQNAITSQQTDSTPQAFDKSSRYNKLKKSQENSSQNMQDSQNPQKSENLQTNDLESTNLEAKDLGKVTATGHKESISAYQSGSSVGKSLLESHPSGNGDITSILKILPNVQFDTASGSSNTPGEIDPAKISISGGLYYQNNFQLDGFNMNNDLDPAGGGTTDNQTSIRMAIHKG